MMSRSLLLILLILATGLYCSSADEGEVDVTGTLEVTATLEVIAEVGNLYDQAEQSGLDAAPDGADVQLLPETITLQIKPGPKLPIFVGHITGITCPKPTTPAKGGTPPKAPTTKPAAPPRATPVREIRRLDVHDPTIPSSRARWRPFAPPDTMARYVLGMVTLSQG